MDKEHAKSIPISEILGKLNYHPTRITSHKALYSSPLRKEKTPSFWVNLKTNRWYDFGEPAGGDLIDFVRMYLKSCKEADTMPDALRWIKNMTANDDYNVLRFPVEQTNSVYEDSSLMLKSSIPLKHLGLVRYLEKRGIDLNIARTYLKELHVHNKSTDKDFIALGFENEDKGFELRNPFFKGSLKPKTISFIRGQNPKPDEIHIFEGFMDYLSLRSQPNHKEFSGDAIVLNSIVCLRYALPYIKNYGYKVAYTWMDNDASGEKATKILEDFFKTESDLKHLKMNDIYTPHKDVNAWHMHKNNLRL